MTIMDELSDDSVWDAFLQQKIRKINGKLRKKEKKERERLNARKKALQKLKNEKEYKQVVEAIREGRYRFKPAVRLEKLNLVNLDLKK